MKVDASFLSPGSYSVFKKEGLYAEFFPDGRLRHLGYYVHGELARHSWALYVEGGFRRARVERVSVHRYERDPEADPTLTEDDAFAGWVRNWIRVISSTADQTVRYCSFCDKSSREVKRLIAGPYVYICNECVELCNEVLSTEVPDLPRDE